MKKPKIEIKAWIVLENNFEWCIWKEGIPSPAIFYTKKKAIAFVESEMKQFAITSAKPKVVRVTIKPL